MVIVVTKQWSGLGLALQLQRQGSQVACAFDYRGLQGKELRAVQRCGDGLVLRMPLADALAGGARDTLFVFDANDFPKEAEGLKAAGAAVLGTSAIGQRLEDDRQFAAEQAQRLGFAVPETEQFTAYAPAIAWLEQRADRAFVYKPDKQDPTRTFVPLDPWEGAAANEELRRYLQSLETGASPKFVLQELIQGVEANVELWLRRGAPLAAWLDLESKRKLAGDVGANVGCAGNFSVPLPLDAPLVQQTVAKYVGWEPLVDYTGSVDANVMLAEDGQAYFLENCFRFGYNAYATIFQALARAPVEEILREWATGTGSLAGAFEPGIGASLTLLADQPQMGAPILLPKEAEAWTYLYRGYHDSRGLAMVDQWPEILCVTAGGETLQDAGEACLMRAQEIRFPDKGYRGDLTDDTVRTLPAVRYAALVERGLIPDLEHSYAET